MGDAGDPVATIAPLAARLVPLVVALVLTACGEAEHGSGRLTVHKSLPEGPISVEGTVTHLRIIGPDGDEVADGLQPVETLDVPIFSRVVPTGTYRVRTVERPCAGNCEQLDPPLEGSRCELKVEVRSNTTTTVTTALRRAGDQTRSDCTATRGR